MACIHRFNQNWWCMDRYVEERLRSHYVIRDVFSGELVPHPVLDGPEMFRSVQRARRRVADLEERRRHQTEIQRMPDWAARLLALSLRTVAY